MTHALRPLRSGRTLAWSLVLLCVLVDPAVAQFLQRQQASGQQAPQLRPQGLLTMRSLKVAGGGPAGSRIYLGPQSDFSIGVDATGSFSMQKAADAKPLLALDASNVLRVAAPRTEALSLDVQADGGISIRGVKQWQLVRSEDFSAGPEAGAGWSRTEVTRCAGVFMLGGYCKFSRGDVNKTFAGLPPHTHLRVVGTFHFIDRWIGEAGYLKLNIGEAGAPVVVWSEQHAQAQSTNGLSLCGQGSTPEGKFAVSIDVVVPHDQASVQLSFGSTMENADPCDESWGVSGVELYTRG